MSTFRRGAIILLCLVASACGAGPSTGSLATGPPMRSVTFSELNGRFFTSLAVMEGSDALRLVPGSRFSILFGSTGEGRLASLTAGCNYMSWLVTSADDAPLRFGSQQSTTQAGCGEAKDQEEWLTHVLNDSPNIGLLDGNLVVRAGDRSVEFDESTTEPEEVLAGRSWQVTGVIVRGQLNRVRPEDMLTIRFESDGTFRTIAGSTSVEGRVDWGRGWLRAEWSGREGRGPDGSDFPSPEVHLPEGLVTVEQGEGHVRLVSDRPYALELTGVE